MKITWIKALPELMRALGFPTVPAHWSGAEPLLMEKRAPTSGAKDDKGGVTEQACDDSRTWWRIEPGIYTV